MPSSSPASRAKIGQAQIGGSRSKRGGLEGRRLLTVVPHRPRAVKVRQVLLGDGPVASNGRTRREHTANRKHGGGSRIGTCSVACASSRPPDHARDGPNRASKRSPLRLCGAQRARVNDAPSADAGAKVFSEYPPQRPSMIREQGRAKQKQKQKVPPSTLRTSPGPIRCSRTGDERRITVGQS